MNKVSPLEFAEKFESWVRENHLKECVECQRKGKARIMDSEVLAVNWVSEFAQSLESLDS